MVSGSWDGEIRFWDLVSKKCLFSMYAHERFVKGICFDHTGNFIYSCGDDMEINIYNVNKVKSSSCRQSAVASTRKK